MKLLITGGKGMLGRTLQRVLSRHTLLIADLPEVDITRLDSISQACRSFQPDVIIHCAAMTRVDDCETAEEAAFLVNGKGSENVALAASTCGARLIAISTDYVFDGGLPRPYRETDLAQPVTVYGKSKLAGERAIQTILPERSTILRIAWLYGEDRPSFVHTMLRLGAQDGAPLKVVDDQRGNPTSTDAVAGLVERLLYPPLTGIVHGSCEGECSWFEFTREIFRLAGLKRGVEPCTTAEFPRPAPRPANSRLEKAALAAAGLPAMPDWRDALSRFFTTRR
ncbi:MAG: dTDP-4-dehydrorhamnose reductase [Kiritimatiellae bacterium]|nr:dTDP-4-dehydrorhamnose reductase [Kiritimatiellia bacterium]